ncbi:MAG: hypothetical protein ACREA0_16925, partial [bacterium]
IASGVADWDGAELADRESRDWQQVYRAGWPFLSLAAHVKRNGEIGGGAVVPTDWLAPDRQDMFMHWGQPEVRGILPMIPMFPQFAYGAGIYALLLWIPVTVGSRLRRWRRLHRGRCPACAYPMGTGALCTECGESFPAQGVSPQR